jgi:ankyrin repeat protein
MAIPCSLIAISLIFMQSFAGQLNPVQNQNSLINAVKSNDLELFSALLNKNDVHQKDEFGKTALAYAAANGNEYMINCILQAGADINARDNLNKTSLMYAVSKAGNIKIVELLLEAGANPSVIDTQHNSVLMYAVLYGDLDIVKLLLNKNHNMNLVNSAGLNVLNLAITQNAEFQVIKDLIMYGCDTESRAAIGGYTSLMHAVYCGRDDVVKELLLNGADQNALDLGGMTARQLAESLGRTQCVRAFKMAKLFKYLRVAKYCTLASVAVWGVVVCANSAAKK